MTDKELLPCPVCNWEGFDTAINLARQVIDNSFEKEPEALWDEIIEEVELYKKDG